MNITYQGGMYELVIDNVGAVQLADTDAVVQVLAESMSNGIGTVVANAEFIFAAGDQIPPAQISAIFTDADVLLLETEEIFDAAALGLNLLEAIAEAGAALLAALG